MVLPPIRPRTRAMAVRDAARRSATATFACDVYSPSAAPHGDRERVRARVSRGVHGGGSEQGTARVVLRGGLAEADKTWRRGELRRRGERVWC